MARLALFDMDRTLVRKETASLYMRHQYEQGAASKRDLLRVAGWVLQYTLGIVDAEKVAAQAISVLRGTSEIAMKARCDDWFQSHVRPHVSDEARRVVRRHEEAGDVLVLATGGTWYGAIPVARHFQIPHVVASLLAVDELGLFTGNFVPPLAYSHGKVTRVRALADRLGHRLEEAAFYSDSITDLPLLEAVAEPYCVNPDVRLARLAKKRGWPILAW